MTAAAAAAEDPACWRQAVCAEDADGGGHEGPARKGGGHAGA